MAVILLIWQLNKDDPPPARPSVEEQRLAEEMRRGEIVASCIRTAKGRFEAAVLADTLLQAVKNGNQTISGVG